VSEAIAPLDPLEHEPPYADIRTMLEAGLVIPFLGAGASMGLRRVDVARDPPLMLPSGSQLAEMLTNRVRPPFPSSIDTDRQDLGKVASWYVATNDRKTLRTVLRDMLVGRYECGRLHHLLAAIERPLLIFTTNYDTLIEEAFIAAGKRYDLVVYPADRSETANAVLWWPHGAEKPIAKTASRVDIDLETTTVIYKMHGTIAKSRRWDNFVVTEDDYVRFLVQLTNQAAVPPIFYELLEEANFLFLGYGLQDWNLRVVLHRLRLAWQRLNGGDVGCGGLGWAIQKNPTHLERELWRTRGVRIYDVELETFTQRLAAAA
jgi:hypothetical protein